MDEGSPPRATRPPPRDMPRALDSMRAKPSAKDFAGRASEQERVRTQRARTAVRTGFFKNITRWDGAVTGGVYEQASEEIEVTAFADGGTLTVSATLLLPGEPPYCFFETFGVQSCQITDGDGKVVMEQKDPVFSRLEDGQASIQIPLEGIKPGDYRLLIRQFAGSAKADQPLTINGIWECHFTLSRL